MALLLLQRMKGSIESPFCTWGRATSVCPHASLHGHLGHAALCHFSGSPSQCPGRLLRDHAWLISLLPPPCLRGFPLPGMETRPVHILLPPTQALQQYPCRLPTPPPLKAALNMAAGSFVRTPGRVDPDVQMFPHHSEQAKGQASKDIAEFKG